MEKKNKLLMIFGGIALVVLVVAVGLVVMFHGKKDSGTKTTEVKEENVDPVIKEAKSYLELSDYKNVTLKTAEIDQELQSNIDDTLEAHATYKKIKKGKVKSGDTVNIYYVGKMDGTAFEGGTCSKETNPEGYDLEIGSNTFIPGFEDGLIGKKVGGTYDINVTFPDEYTPNPDYAGKDAVFTVTINSMQGKKIMPKLTDEFVKENLTDYTSVKDYKEKLRKSIIRSKAISQVVNDSKITKYPEDQMKAMKKQLRTSIESYLSQQGATLDDYLESTKSSKDDYDKQVEKTAKENVGSQIVYNAILQAENKEVTEEEYKEALDKYLTNYNCEKESDLDKSFQSMYGAKAKNIIYSDLLYDKAADLVAELVKEE